MNLWEKVLIGPNATIREALIKIDAVGTQMALVTDEARHLLGTLSDGDIRRGLLKGLSLSDTVERCMRTNPTTARDTDAREEVLSLMRQRKLHQVPIVDANNVVCGLEVVKEFVFSRERQNRVVVMAGGLGSRLRELTEETPKPMLRVGARPLLETVLRSFLDHGFRHFYLAVNYKADVIERHFGDGKSMGAEIHYLRERERLGTAGALSLLPEIPAEPILVANADLLMKVDYPQLLDAHVESQAAATMAVHEYEYQIPYGVVEEANGIIQRIQEKPLHRVLVSAGVYVLSPDAIRLVPVGASFDMPSLFDELILRGRRTRCHLVRGYWLDIGRLPDYEKANRDYPGVFE
jgi:dTDP-glucose pyrophosphorylase